MFYAIFARSDDGAWYSVQPQGAKPWPPTQRASAERLAAELGKSGRPYVVVAGNTAVMAEELLLRLNQVNTDLVDLEVLLASPDNPVPLAVRQKVAELREHANPS